MSKLVWCVKHIAGWCASKPNRRHAETAFSVETRCGYFIALPHGCDKRTPDCKECIAALTKEPES